MKVTCNLGNALILVVDISKVALFADFWVHLKACPNGKLAYFLPTTTELCTLMFSSK